jgi:hypothetical protein
MFPFDLLHSTNPYEIAFGTYFILSALVGVAVGVMLIVPRWRERLWTTPGMFLFVLGVLGLGKVLGLLLFSPLYLHAWNPTVANVAAITVAVLLLIGVVAGITVWLKHRLRGPQPLRRVAQDTVFYGGILVGLYLVDLVEKRYQIPAFWIAFAVLVPAIVVTEKWRVRRKAHDEDHATTVREA